MKKIILIASLIFVCSITTAFADDATTTLPDSSATSTPVASSTPPAPAPDTTPPVITLNGNSSLSLNVGDVYIEQGATTTDPDDSSVPVSITGTVDTTTAGTYTVHYNAADPAGNQAAEVLRTVTVNAPASTTPVATPPPTPPAASPVPTPQPSAPPPPPVSEPQPQPALQPSAPTVQPVVPFTSTNGLGFNPETAPSKVTIRIVTPDGQVPTVPVFVTYVGVGGTTYGGPIDRQGQLETVLPSGRYYTDILVVSTDYGPPTNPPSFFLDSNVSKDFGVLTLSSNSAFVDPNLENQVATTLNSTSGMAKVLALIVKLLLSILQEIRSMHADMINK